jgi:hypothetical protein
MNQRVFVSSTYIDLTEHRRAVQTAIRQLGAIDISMENFGARDERPKTECLRIIHEESDLFVGIYAHRYGYIPDGEHKSITEYEYDAAGNRNLPRFIYLVDEDIEWKPSFIDSGAAGEKLRQLKLRLKTRHACQTFSNKDQLATFVAADLGRHISRQELRHVPSGGADGNSPRVANDGDWKEWNKYRAAEYARSREVFLVHSLAPSTEPGQLYDIFIYLKKHWTGDLSEIAHAQFYLGRWWGHRVYDVPNNGGHIGIRTAAYGEFLCVCRVVFKDGQEVVLDRYINFDASATSQ